MIKVTLPPPSRQLSTPFVGRCTVGGSFGGMYRLVISQNAMMTIC